MKRSILLVQTTLLLLMPGYLSYFNEVLTSMHLESYEDLTYCGSSAHFLPDETIGITSKYQSEESVLKQIEAQRYSINKIVIDPGHGGRDGGCSGTNSSEKIIALQIALKLGKQIETYFPEVEVIFTRKTDVFIPLHKRAEIANENEADLFISIHCNYIVKAASIRGSETYVMGLHKAEHNLEVAKRENEVIYLEDNYSTNYGVDPNSAEGHIILSAYQHAYLEQSILFAEKVEKNVKQTTKHKSRGVKQAGFYVLKNTTMPSVLIETGYLSNARDQNYLLSQAGQREISEAIWKAFTEYKAQIDNEDGLEPTIVYNKPELESVTEPEEESVISKKEEEVNSIPSEELVPNKREDSIPKVRKVVQETGIVSNTTPSKEVDKPSKVIEKPRVDYRIQLAASQKELNLNSGKWRNVGYEIVPIREDIYFKYQIRSFESIEEASRVKLLLKKQGFKDAFLVAYYEGKKISLAQAGNL